jgi:hypothetical protein
MFLATMARTAYLVVTVFLMKFALIGQWLITLIDPHYS